MIKKAQIKALKDWITRVERIKEITPLIPIDFERLKEILDNLLRKLKQSEDDANMMLLEDSLIPIATELATGLAKLGGVRDSLILVKDMHTLFPIKQPLFEFIMSLMRELEAYADELHTVPNQVHKMAIEIPNMVDALNLLIEASFVKKTLSDLADDAAKSIENFSNACPDDLKVSLDSMLKLAIETLHNFALVSNN